jgi:NADPH:quinone reductase
MPRVEHNRQHGVRQAAGFAEVQQMITKAEAGCYQAKPAKVFGFDQIVEAHRAMEEGLAAGKMVVAVS